MLSDEGLDNVYTIAIWSDIPVLGVQCYLFLNGESIFAVTPWFMHLSQSAALLMFSIEQNEIEMFSETLKDPVFWQKSVHWHILWIFINVSGKTYFQNSQEVFASLKLLLPLNFFLLVIEKRRNLAMSSQITLRPRSHYHFSKKCCNLRVSRVSWFFNCFHSKSWQMIGRATANRFTSHQS